MPNRDKIKWAPFSSVIDGKVLIDSIIKEKNKLIKPTLSDEQIKQIEKTIIDSYESVIPLLFTYYKNGNIYNYKGIVIKIDSVYSKIYLDKNRCLYFGNIIKTSYLSI